MHYFHFSHFFLICFFCFVLNGCSGAKDKASLSPMPEKTAEEIYQEAKGELKAHHFKKAIDLFDEVEGKYPYSQWATKAQLMAAYSAYEGMRYDEALMKLERFIDLHPGNEDIAYAYYLRALCFYEQISDVKRDQKITEEAYHALGEVIARFPNSKYAQDAKLKQDLTLDHLAGHEMLIGRYYQNQKYPNAAAARFQNVLEKYPTTQHIPEALFRLVETYHYLGFDEEAQKYAATLGYNYPDSYWYRSAYKLIKNDAEENHLVEPPKRNRIKKFFKAFFTST